MKSAQLMARNQSMSFWGGGGGSWLGEAVYLKQMSPLITTQEHNYKSTLLVVDTGWSIKRPHDQPCTYVYVASHGNRNHHTTQCRAKNKVSLLVGYLIGH